MFLRSRIAWMCVVAASILGLLPRWLSAHPGHGTTDPASPAHLLEPVHFVALLTCLGVVGLISAVLVRRRSPTWSPREAKQIVPRSTPRRESDA